MTYFTPLIPASERPPALSDRTPTILCISCGDTMKYSRTIEKLGIRPEQFVFVCPSCKGVDSKEAKRVA
jgi:hypothetical protein